MTSSSAGAPSRGLHGTAAKRSAPRVANSAATSLWPLARMLTPSGDPTDSSLSSVERLSRETSSIGGCMDSDMKALTVLPCGSSPAYVVTTATGLATCRMAALNSVSSTSVIASTPVCNSCSHARIPCRAPPVTMRPATLHRMDVLISAPDLADALASDRPPVVLDVRWKLGGPPGHEEYLRGHIPGAVYVDLDTELSTHGEPTEGRHPLPSLEALQASARRWGIDEGDTVVVYDGEGNLASARAWWLLRWAGVADVRLLDGALPAWKAAGHPLATDDVW